MNEIKKIPNDEEFKYDLERSSYYNKRLELLKLNQAPKLSQARENLGELITKVVIDQCENDLKQDFGLKPQLEGPGDLLWISPSDLLIGKVVLKPPFTAKCLQALTHQAIIELGEEIEQKFIEQNELERQQAMEQCKEEMIKQFEEELKEKLKRLEIRLKLQCQIELDEKQLVYEELLNSELNKVATKIRKEYEKNIKDREYDLRAQCQLKIEEEIELVVNKVTKEFMIKLEEQEIKLTNAYELELKKMEILRGFDAKIYNEKMTRTLRQLKHNLECTNLVNMLYVLCNERQKCCKQLNEIKENFDKKLTETNKQLKNKQQTIVQLNENKRKQQHKIQIREKLLMELMKQFQKFINFALKTSPTQAEFLLSIEKMLTYEFTNELLKTATKKLQIGKRILKSKKPQNEILPWKSCEKIASKHVPFDINVNDFHNCFNELDQSKVHAGDDDDARIEPSGSLPSIYFKNKLYIREDFRNKLRKSIEIDSNHELWNRDARLLVETWKTIPSTQRINYDCYSDNDIEKEWKEEEDGGESEKSPQQKLSSITKSNGSEAIADDGDELRNEKVVKQPAVKFNDLCSLDDRISSSVSIQKQKKSKKSSLKPSSFNSHDLLKPIYINTNTDGKLLGTKDSIEILIERKKKCKKYEPYYDDQESVELVTIPEDEVEYQIPSSSPPATSKDIVVEAKDSVILHKVSLIKKSNNEFNASPRDSIDLLKDSLIEKSDGFVSKPSKLKLARNSVEMLRESLMKLRESKSSNMKKADAGTRGSCSEICRKKLLKHVSCGGTEAERSYVFKFSNLDSDDHYVKMSHIEIINLDVKVPTCARSTTATSTSTKHMSKPSRHKKTKKSARNVTEKKYGLKVVGDLKAVEETNHQFTGARIHSLIDLMKDEPSLMRLFTAGVK